jgi:hypothetical protein
VIPFRTLAAVHGAYYTLTGAWSLVHRRSFERVTGKKDDYWLVRTVGALAVAIGAPLGLAAVTKREEPEVVVLALGSCIAFVVGDLQAVQRGSRVYLGDAAVHGLLFLAWLGHRNRP